MPPRPGAGGVDLIGLAYLVFVFALLFIPVFFGRNPSGPPGPDSDSDDGRGGGPRRPLPKPERPKGGLPLPDAVQARVRLRHSGRLMDLLPRRERRPAREPERAPVRIPAADA